MAYDNGMCAHVWAQQRKESGKSGNDQWNWCGVVVTASRAGVELGTASLWGIESNAGVYLVEVANELTAEALAEAAAKVREIAA